MRLSRIVIKNYRSLRFVDVPIKQQATVVIGENNTGKSNLFQAIRLCLDVTLSSTYRALVKDDIHSGVDRSRPFQVLVGVEFTAFAGNDNEEAMLLGTQIEPDRARIFYRFRPKRKVREAIEAGDREDTSLTLDDYSWELVGGGNPAVDLKDIEWDHENDAIGASTVGLQYLQAFLVVPLQALRDVEADLSQQRRSPLARLIEASGIALAEQATLIAAARAANDAIEGSPTVQLLATQIDEAFKGVTGPAFSMDVDLGLSEPSFQAIVRNIRLLLSNAAMTDFEPSRNGLGLNNVLYISILVEYFRKRAAQGKTAGELLLIEEPEAHLHPQLQMTLLGALRALPFQSIVTTHSTHVTATAPLESFVFLTNVGTPAPLAGTPAQNAALTPADIADLQRYLDATKSGLLFARKVMLVEGAAELFLLPALVKKVTGRDLEREGISIIAIHGVHFGAFTRLFRATCLPKKCAIVADADLTPGETVEVVEGDDMPTAATAVTALEGDFVKAFLGTTTFEREITLPGNLSMLAQAAADLGAPRASAALQAARVAGTVTEGLKDQVLRTAKRFGKARFAQVSARHVDGATELPAYVRDAIDWLIAP